MMYTDWRAEGSGEGRVERAHRKSISRTRVLAGRESFPPLYESDISSKLYVAQSAFGTITGPKPVKVDYLYRSKASLITLRATLV
jgi:hypothetical protein